MCEPTTIAIGLTALAAGTAAYGQYQSGKFQEAQAKTNAELAEHQALDAQRRGAIAEEEQRARVRALLGAQRSTFGANNVVSSTGSPLGILTETAQYGELDALTVRNNAAREAFGYRVDSMNSRNRGQLARLQGNYGAAATLLAGGAQSYGIWRANAGYSTRPARSSGGGIVPGGTRWDRPATPPSTRGYA